MDSPFFVIGTERSGSNLLRLILTSHSRLAVPHPPHLVRYFRPLEGRYGDLGDDPAFRRLVGDVRALLDTHIYPWDVTIDWDRVAREARPRDAFGVQFALYAQYAAAKGKARWGCKSTFHVADVPALRERLPGARFLWLFRDPRDVAASARKSVFSATHPVSSAELWRDQQAQAFAAEQTGDDVLRVRYEDLIRDPEAEVRRICAFLGEAFEPAMLRYHETDEARRSGELSESWKRTAEPIARDNRGKYRKVLSDEEIGWVEGICAEGMAELGYAPEHPPVTPRFDAATRARFRRQERVEELRIEVRSLLKDKNVLRRWRRAWLLRRLGWGS
jgi:hypothetical protein